MQTIPAGEEKNLSDKRITTNQPTIQTHRLCIVLEFLLFVVDRNSSVESRLYCIVLCCVGHCAYLERLTTNPNGQQHLLTSFKLSKSNLKIHIL